MNYLCNKIIFNKYYKPKHLTQICDFPTSTLRVRSRAKEYVFRNAGIESLGILITISMSQNRRLSLGKKWFNTKNISKAQHSF